MSSGNSEKKFTFVVTNSDDQGTWTTRREEIWSQINTHVAYAAHGKRAAANDRARPLRRASKASRSERIVPFQNNSSADHALPPDGRADARSSDLYAPLEELVDLLEGAGDQDAPDFVPNPPSARSRKPPAARPSRRPSQQQSATDQKSLSTRSTDEPRRRSSLLRAPSHNNYARFDRNRPEDLNPTVQMMHHEAMAETWPTLRPADPAIESDTVENILFGFETMSDAFYYCSLYVSSIQYRVRRRDEVQIPTHIDWTCLKLKAQALRYLQLEIDALQGAAVPDSILCCIAALAAQEPHAYSQPHYRTKRVESVLGRYSGLNLVRYMRPLIAHVMAMYSMVNQRGGLDQVSAFGLSHLLALNDLIAANSTAGTPRFPLIWRADIQPDPGAILVLKTPLLDFGTSFYPLAATVHEKIHPFLNLLPQIKEVTFALAHCHYVSHDGRRPLDRRRLKELVEAANSAHYQILNLRLSPTSGASSQSTVLESIRLAALIYSNFTLFPLGLQSGMPGMFAAKLRSLLLKEKHSSCFLLDLPQELTLWIMIMGAIGSLEDAKLLSWYIEKLKPLVGTMCRNDLGVLVDRLRGYLWWDHVFASYLQDVWSVLVSPIRGCLQTR